MVFGLPLPLTECLFSTFGMLFLPLGGRLIFRSRSRGTWIGVERILERLEELLFSFIACKRTKVSSREGGVGIGCGERGFEPEVIGV